ncbi:hypothetical protein LJK88_26165 [Paenibacillus sp. P26]|nr:hypothetical protein LJK88_26165 [Paenibacillus sp. P26]
MVKLLQPHAADFVDQRRDRDRHGKLENQPAQRDDERIAERHPKILQTENFPEVREPDPFAAPNALSKVELLEREDNAVKRDVIEHDVIRKRRQGK